LFSALFPIMSPRGMSYSFFHIFVRSKLGFNQAVTEMNTRSIQIMFLGSKVRPVRRANNLIAICEPIV
jgi:hypothetical protein